MAKKDNKKKNRKDDFKGFSDSDLAEKVIMEKARYHKVKFSHAVNAIENPLSIRSLRKDIARMMTELRKRELAQNIK